MSIYYDLPTISAVHHYSDDGLTYHSVSYVLLKSGNIRFNNIEVPDEYKLDPRHYHGKIRVQLNETPRPSKLVPGSVFTLGEYRLRVVEVHGWNFEVICVLDRPLSRLYVWQYRAIQAWYWLASRIMLTAQIWGVIDFDKSSPIAGWPPITHVFGRKIGKRS